MRDEKKWFIMITYEGWSMLLLLSCSCSTINCMATNRKIFLISEAVGIKSETK